MPTRRQPGRIILVVDDEEAIRRLIEAILISEGYQVVQAADGMEAWEIFLEIRNSLDAIVTDLLMPRMDGYDLIRSIREIVPAVPIIVISGHAEKGLPYGPHLKVIRKPFTKEKLVEALKQATAGSG